MKIFFFTLNVVFFLGCKVVSLDNLNTNNTQLSAQENSLVGGDWCASVLQRDPFGGKNMFDCLLRVRLVPRTNSNLRPKSDVKISCKSRSNQTIKTTNTMNCEFGDDHILCDNEKYSFNIDRNILYTDLIESVSSFTTCSPAQSQAFSYNVF